LTTAYRCWPSWSRARTSGPSACGNSCGPDGPDGPDGPGGSGRFLRLIRLVWLNCLIRL
jgi:hypothetical protein